MYDKRRVAGVQHFRPFTGNISVDDCMPLFSLLQTIEINGVQCRYRQVVFNDIPIDDMAVALVHMHVWSASSLRYTRSITH